MKRIRVARSAAARKEVIFRNGEKEKRAAELIIANQPGTGLSKYRERET